MLFSLWIQTLNGARCEFRRPPCPFPGRGRARAGSVRGRASPCRCGSQRCEAEGPARRSPCPGRGEPAMPPALRLWESSRPPGGRPWPGIRPRADLKPRGPESGWLAARGQSDRSPEGRRRCAEQPCQGEKMRPPAPAPCTPCRTPPVAPAATFFGGVLSVFLNRRRRRPADSPRRSREPVPQGFGIAFRRGPHGYGYGRAALPPPSCSLLPRLTRPLSPPRPPG